MKMIVKLAVLFTVLLWMHNMVFALPPTPCPASCTGWQGCYSVDVTNLDDPSGNYSGNLYVCINGTSGYMCSSGNQVADLSVFTQGLNLQMLMYPVNSSQPSAAGQVTFHGSWANHDFNGILFNGNRLMLHGYYIPCR